MKHLLVFYIALFIIACELDAAEFFVSPEGLDTNPGTTSLPWSLTKALSHPSAVQAGDTIWVRGGRYSVKTGVVNADCPAPKGCMFYSVLRGTESHRILVCASPNEHVVVDGLYAPGAIQSAIILFIRGAYTTFKDIEFTSSDTGSRYTADADYSARPGGVNVRSPGIKIINCVIHDLFDGYSTWIECSDFEGYGNVMFNTGWKGTDRGHGHNIYTQNGPSNLPQRHLDNIMLNSFDISIQCYGSSNAMINHYRFEHNVNYNKTALIGGYYSTPVSDIVFRNNYLYNSALQTYYRVGIGYQDQTIDSNYFGFGPGTSGQMFGTAAYRNSIVRDNIFASASTSSSFAILTNMATVRCFSTLDSMMFLGAIDGVYISSDSGASWIASNAGLSKTDVQALICNVKTLYAGLANGGVCKSDDRGKSWSPLTTGLSSSTLDVRDFAVFNGELYAATEKGVYRLGGAGSWSAVNGGLLNLDVHCLASDGSSLYAGTTRSGTTGGVYRLTVDTWSDQNVNAPSGISSINDILCVGPDMYCAANANAVYRVSSGIWSAFSSGITPNAYSSVNVLAMTRDSSALLAGTSLFGLFRCAEFQSPQWKASGTGLVQREILSIYPSATKIFAGLQGVATSAPDGMSWTMATKGLTDFARGDYKSWDWNRNRYYGQGSFGISNLGFFSFANWKSRMGFDSSSLAMPSTPPDTIIVRPNIYDTNRANVIVYNWSKTSHVTVDVRELGWNSNDSIRIRNASDYYNDVRPSLVIGSAVTLDMSVASHTVALPYGYSQPLGANTFPEFGAFVVERVPRSLSSIVREVESAVMNFYPNPVTKQLNIECGNTSCSLRSLEIYSAIGELMESKSVTVESPELITSIDISAYPVGVYVVKCTWDSSSVSRVIVKM